MIDWGFHAYLKIKPPTKKKKRKGGMTPKTKIDRQKKIESTEKKEHCFPKIRTPPQPPVHANRKKKKEKKNPPPYLTTSRNAYHEQSSVTVSVTALSSILYVHNTLTPAQQSNPRARGG